MDDKIKLAQEKYQRDEASWSDVYDKAREDLHFLSDDEYAQWTREDYQSRTGTNRPAITIDQLTQFVHQVANDIRMNTPSIGVIPGDGGDTETADVFKGLIRNIEYVSRADDAYDTAALNAVKSSIGFIRVDHDYASETGFEQQLLIKRVHNPLSCYLDCDSIESDGSDAQHATILDKMLAAEFKRKYPGFDPVSFEGKNPRTSKDDEYLLIAEHFFLEHEERDIVLLEDGSIADFQDGIDFRARRKVKRTKVRRQRMSGADILEETIFPGIYVPLVPVYGEEAWIEGKRHIHSLIRKSKSGQRMFNLWKSLETELLMKQPNAPVMAAEGSIEDYAQDWSNPAKSMALRYKLFDGQGRQLPKPERLSPPQVPTGVVNAARGAVDDIMATMGMYNASLGKRSNEQSGRAISERKQEGDVATYHFGDNLTRSVGHVGKILVNAAPDVYDTPRIVRIIGREEEHKSVGINGMPGEDGKTYDLAKGKYDVRVTTSAPFTTKRQEAAQFYTDIVTRQPELMQVMGDLLFKYSDFAGASAMAERMKKVIDPKFLSDEDRAEVQGQDPEKEQMQQVIEQGAQMLQQLEGQVEMAQKKLEAAQTEKDIELAKVYLKAQQDALKAQQRENDLLMQLYQKDLQLAQQAQQRATAQELGISA